MRQRQSFFRGLTVPLLLCALMAGVLGGAGLSARAAPEKQTSTGDVVISEFRTSGPGGGNDEFIELYNRTSNPKNIDGWLLQRSSSSGSTTGNPRYTFSGITLQPGQRYLVVGSSYSGSVWDIKTDLEIADNGGIALTQADSTKVDAVGMSSGSTYKEGTPLAPLSGNSDQSYARRNNGCTDTNDNSADFVLQSPSDPQNSTSIPVKCLRVTNVFSKKEDGTFVNGTFIAGASIPVTIEFSSNVNVTGAPTLLLETGSQDRTATYSGGSGSNILTFNYIVQTEDVSADLDYVATNSLSLSGGMIIGAVGDADLTLPVPGTPPVPGGPNSLGANNNIVIDNQKVPSLISFKRQDPPTSPTNLDTLIFRVTFSEPVTGVSTGNFSINFSGTGTPPSVAGVTPINSSTTGYASVYDVAISSGGGIGEPNGTVELKLSSSSGIEDAAGDDLLSTVPTSSESYILDNVVPTVVTIVKADGQADPASGTPVIFTVTFSEDINVSTFIAADITQSGIPPSLVTWSISGGPKVFTLSAIAVAGNGTLSPSIGADKVMDLAGNKNIASTSIVTVQFNDNIPPTVEINHDGQIDPTSSLPIKFNVVFSEPVIPSIFTPSDITQSGDATGITWSITDSGDHKKFILSATAVSGYGFLIPSIAANRVTDLVGNNNTASTSADNKVKYIAIKPLTVVINEVAWAGTLADTEDEWIEFYNPGPDDINLTNWVLSSSDGSPNIALSGTIDAGEYYLLERDNNDTVANITADLIYTGSLANTGEILRLYAPNNNLVDTANFNGGSWPAGILATFSSMERSLVKADSDYVWVTYDATKDSLAEASRATDARENIIKGTPRRANSRLNVTPTPTPASGSSGSSSGSTGSGGTVAPILGISEFLPRPGYDWNNDGQVDVFDEFIEIINAGTVDANLGAYRLDDEENQDSSPFALPGIVLKAGERAVFYAADTGIMLSDAGDTVRLLRGSAVVDAHTYGVARYPDQSWCRIPDRLGYWNKPCFPTPNNPNALTGNLPLPSKPLAGYRAPLCLMPDTTPDVFVYAECEATGGGIWNRQYWDGSGLFQWLILHNDQKWDTFIK